MQCNLEGRCHCGAVRYTGRSDPVYSCECHCLDCRRLSGAGHLALMAVPAADMVFTGPLKAYGAVVDSGATVTNHFCGDCGSQIYKTGELMPDVAFIVASTLENPDVFQPRVSLYTSRALSWDPPNPATTHHEKMPPG